MNQKGQTLLPNSSLTVTVLEQELQFTFSTHMIVAKKDIGPVNSSTDSNLQSRVIELTTGARTQTTEWVNNCINPFTLTPMRLFYYAIVTELDSMDDLYCKYTN